MTKAHVEFRSDYDHSSSFTVYRNGQSQRVMVCIGLYRSNHRHHPVLEESEAYAWIGTVRLPGFDAYPDAELMALFEERYQIKLVAAKWNPKTEQVEYETPREEPLDCGHTVYCPSYHRRLQQLEREWRCPGLAPAPGTVGFRLAG